MGRSVKKGGGQKEIRHPEERSDEGSYPGSPYRTEEKILRFAQDDT